MFFFSILPSSNISGKLGLSVWSREPHQFKTLAKPLAWYGQPLIGLA